MKGRSDHIGTVESREQVLDVIDIHSSLLSPVGGSEQDYIQIPTQHQKVPIQLKLNAILSQSDVLRPMVRCLDSVHWLKLCSKKRHSPYSLRRTENNVIPALTRVYHACRKSEVQTAHLGCTCSNLLPAVVFGGL